MACSGSFLPVDSTQAAKTLDKRPYQGFAKERKQLSVENGESGHLGRPTGGKKEGPDRQYFSRNRPREKKHVRRRIKRKLLLRLKLESGVTKNPLSHLKNIIRLKGDDWDQILSGSIQEQA